MAFIEICDICKKEVDKRNGITIDVSDMDGLEWIGGSPVRKTREYKVRVCDRCVENIKTYCRKNTNEKNSFSRGKLFHKK